MNRATVIREASFTPLVKTYIFWYGFILLVISVIGLPLLPFWVLGIGQLVGRRFYRNLSCKLQAKALFFRKGSLVQIEKTIPLEQIQDLTFVSGPLLKFFNLSMLKVETAGSSGDDTALTILGIINAEAFKEAVLDQRESLTAREDANTDSAGSYAEVVSLLREIRDTLGRLEPQDRSRPE
jgi:Uncharacterized conserved protein